MIYISPPFFFLSVYLIICRDSDFWRSAGLEIHVNHTSIKFLHVLFRAPIYTANAMYYQWQANFHTTIRPVSIAPIVSLPEINFIYFLITTKN